MLCGWTIFRQQRREKSCFCGPGYLSASRSERYSEPMDDDGVVTNEDVYSAPAVVVLGSVEELTHGLGGPGTDSVSGIPGS
jgi:hypothetical protein